MSKSIEKTTYGWAIASKCGILYDGWYYTKRAAIDNHIIDDHGVKCYTWKKCYYFGDRAVKIVLYWN